MRVYALDTDLFFFTYVVCQDFLLVHSLTFHPFLIVSFTEKKFFFLSFDEVQFTILFLVYIINYQFSLYMWLGPSNNSLPFSGYFSNVYFVNKKKKKPI